MITPVSRHHPLHELLPFAWQLAVPTGEDVVLLWGDPRFNIRHQAIFRSFTRVELAHFFAANK